MEQDYEAVYSGIAALMTGTTFLIGLVVGIIGIIAMWKVFTKAGEPGWASIIPIYNMYTLAKVAYGNGLKFLFCLVPLLQLVFPFALYLRIGQNFGKSTGWCIIFLWFLTPIGLLMLGFGNDYYEGPNTQAFI